MTLAEERAAFNKMMRAKALLVAVEWAGSASRLAEMIGYTRHAGAQWVRRAYITPTAAHLLEALPGFPVKALDLIGNADNKPTKKPRCCPHCYRVIRLPGEHAGYSSSFNDLSKRLRKVEAAKRKKAKQQAAARQKKAAAKQAA